MNLAALFIRRPIMTGLVMATLLLFGIVAYRNLPVSDLPNVDYPVINVSASLPGANPDTMASAVATPMEKEFTTIAGLDSMNSMSTQGGVQISLQFVLSRDIDAAAQDVQAAIARALTKLPTMPTPPAYRKVNPADLPILYLALTSATDPMYVVDEAGQTVMAQRISTIDGVAQVLVYGSQKYAVRAQVDPYELASRGIGINEVFNAINDQHVNLPVGILNGDHQARTIQANGQLMAAREYDPLIIRKAANGQPVRLKDVGRAIDDVENNLVAAWFYSKDPDHPDDPAKFAANRSIVLAIQRQPGTNTVEVAQAVKDMLPALREQIPASISIDVLIDRSITIKESAQDVQFTLVLTLGLVVLVIFLFLRNLSATIIPSLTLPMSIVGTFIVMFAMNYSLDNLSLMALTLSVGFVVDDAIVMLENIVRHMEMGKPRMQASFDGSAEIGFTIVSMTLSLAAVFIPVLFMGGIVGRLFREFSITIGAAVLVSGVVSLTLTPMLASRFLRSQHGRKHNWAYRAIEKMFDGMLAFYGWTLRATLRHRRITMLVSAGVMYATVQLFMQIPKDFIPAEDRDQLRVVTEASQDISLQAMIAHQKELAKVIQADPNVDRFISSVGAGGPNRAPNNATFMILLKPHSERAMTADQVMENLRPRLNAFPGIRAMIQNPPVINVSARPTKGVYQLTLQASDMKALYKYASDLEARLADRDKFPELLDIASDLQIKNPQLNIKIDRDQAKLLDVTPFMVEDALYSAFSARQVSTIYAPLNQYQVILELLPQYQKNPDALAMLYVRSASQQLVPIKAVAAVTEDVGPMMVNHSGQLPSVTISFNLKPGVALGDATQNIRAAMVGDLAVPSGITTAFQGNAQAFEDSMKGMVIQLILAVIVIYVVLGILYENLYHPITILSALPFAGVGAILTLMIFHLPLSIYAFVGIIMLIGLVKKNGIMMVDFALDAQRTEGMAPADAIYRACMVRFRPIMMTTMAALMGGLPIAMGLGAGAEARRPLGLAVVGGLLFSQSLTLYVTPVFYLYMEKLQHAVQGWMGSPADANPVEGAPAPVSAD